MFRELERFLLPNCCICCSRIVPTSCPDDLVCSVCASRLRSMGHGCERCEQPLPPVGPCRFCATWTDALVNVRSAVWLDREARTMVHQLKYGHSRRVGETIADIMTKLLAKPKAAALIPVPTTPRRLRQRGYNQAEIIAAALSRHWSVPFLPDGLVRVKQNRSQTALTPSNRTANVSTAFEARRLEIDTLMHHTVVVVDDVLTTGATLDACARALESAGWGAVEGLSFARAKTYELRAVGY